MTSKIDKKFNLPLQRFSLFLIIWIVLTNADLKSLIIGIPFIIIAVITSMYLLPKTQISFRSLIGFLPLFLWYSLKGAVDVARRVFHPNLPIKPKIVNYSLKMNNDISRVFMMNLISLLPGTLSVNNNQNDLKIHVLDIESDFENELIKIEDNVLKIFKQ